MLIFTAPRLAYLATPKTGSTAIEMALRSDADIIFSRRRKHINAQRFDTHVAPFLAAGFGSYPDRVAVMRDPLDQIASWYRYRRSAARRGSSNGTQGICFDAFVRAVISENPPAFAGIGSQLRFFGGAGGGILLHRLIAYECMERLRAMFETRLERPVRFTPRNVSQQADCTLEPATLRALRRARAAEFALYARLMAAGGEIPGDLA